MDRLGKDNNGLVREAPDGFLAQQLVRPVDVAEIAAAVADDHLDLLECRPGIFARIANAERYRNDVAVGGEEIHAALEDEQVADIDVQRVVEIADARPGSDGLGNIIG